MNSVRCVALGAEVPATADSNLDFAFVENVLFSYFSKNWRSTAPSMLSSVPFFIPFIPLFQVGGPQHGRLIASAFTLLRHNDRLRNTMDSRLKNYILGHFPLNSIDTELKFL